MRYLLLLKEKHAYDHSLSGSATQVSRSEEGGGGTDREVQEAIRTGFLVPCASTDRATLEKCKAGNVPLNGKVHKLQVEKAFKGVPANSVTFQTDGTYVQQILYWYGGHSFGDATGCDHVALDAHRARLWAPFNPYFTDLLKTAPSIDRTRPEVAGAAPVLDNLLAECVRELPLMDDALAVKKAQLDGKLAELTRRVDSGEVGEGDVEHVNLTAKKSWNDSSRLSGGELDIEKWDVSGNEAERRLKQLPPKWRSPRFFCDDRKK